MITVLTGDNSFEVQRALDALLSSYDGAVEKVDGESLTLAQLPDLVMGATLFSSKRFIVLKNLSQNKTLWSVFSEWLDKVSDDIHVVLVDASLDKRTKTYKALQKNAAVHEYKAWTERDAMAAEKWASDEAKKRGFALGRPEARLLVARVGVDQWALDQALSKLSVLDVVSTTEIESFIDATPTENVFLLFESALKGDSVRISEMIRTLSLTEDPYRVFGLLSGQAFQLAALALGDKTHADIAKDIGAHPFALGKLAPYAKRKGRSGARDVLRSFTKADAGMKTSVGEPWLLVEKALLEVASH